MGNSCCKSASVLNPITVIPEDLKAGDILGFKVIAVIGHVNDWAAYRGLTCYTDEEVIRFGDKLCKEEAEPLFYVCKAAGLKYRS